MNDDSRETLCALKSVDISSRDLKSVDIRSRDLKYVDILRRDVRSVDIRSRDSVMIDRASAQQFQALVRASTPPDVSDGRVAMSVIVASYNRIGSLETLLSQLDVQVDVVKGFEVVVVDDESRDPVAPHLAGRSFSFTLRVLRRPNGGPGVARDTGIAIANGDIIVIVDDDMTIPTTFLAAHQHHHADGAYVVLGHIRSPNELSLPLFERFHQATLDKFVAANESGSDNIEGIRLCTGNVSFRTSAYKAVGGFDLSLRRCEDRDLGIRFERAGFRMVFGKDAWSEHRSDHEDVKTWRDRNALYGSLDERISRKHPEISKVSPWSFLKVLPKVAVGPALISALIPPIGAAGAALAYQVASRLDRSKNAAALKLAGLCYGLDYYRGVGQELGAPRKPLAVVRSFMTYRKRQRV